MITPVQNNSSEHIHNVTKFAHVLSVYSIVYCIPLNAKGDSCNGTLLVPMVSTVDMVGPHV